MRIVFLLLMSFLAAPPVFAEDPYFQSLMSHERLDDQIDSLTRKLQAKISQSLTIAEKNPTSAESLSSAKDLLWYQIGMSECPNSQSYPTEKLCLEFVLSHSGKNLDSRESFNDLCDANQVRHKSKETVANSAANYPVKQDADDARACSERLWAISERYQERPTTTAIVNLSNHLNDTAAAASGSSVEVHAEAGTKTRTR